MYAICQVIFGIPLNENNEPTHKHSEELETCLEDEHNMFLRYYSGGSDVEPQAFGIELDQFDEACHHVELDGLTLKPSKAQVDEFIREWKKLSTTLQLELSENYGEPRVFLLWSTS